MTDTEITIHGDQTIFAPGLIDWCMHCTRTTFDEIASDTAARMYALADFMPEVSATIVKQLAQGRITYTVDEEANTVTLKTTQEPK